LHIIVVEEMFEHVHQMDGIVYHLFFELLVASKCLDFCLFFEVVVNIDLVFVFWVDHQQKRNQLTITIRRIFYEWKER
jgi:hypothetical protein